MPKDHSNITQPEALQWVDDNCRCLHNRKRIRSRAVAFLLGSNLLVAMDYIDDLQKEIAKLKGESDG